MNNLAGDALVADVMTRQQDERNKPQIAPLEFWTDYRPDPERPGQLKGDDWVRWVKKGGNGATTEDRVARVQKHQPAHWAVLKPRPRARRSGPGRAARASRPRRCRTRISARSRMCGR
jgi:hypothetical protein